MISLLGGRIRIDHTGTDIDDRLFRRLTDVGVVVVLVGLVILQVMSYVSGYNAGYKKGVSAAWAQRDRPRGGR